METEITLDELRAMSVRAGLNLHDQELERLSPGVQRSRRQTLELRQLVSDEIEPAAHFVSPPGK